MPVPTGSVGTQADRGNGEIRSPSSGVCGAQKRTEDLVSYDYGEFQTSELGDNLKTTLQGLADKFEEASTTVEMLEAELAVAKENLRRVGEHEIPSLMDGMRGSLTLPDGREVSVREKTRANISKENKPVAYSWMESRGYGSIIRNRIIVDLPAGQEKLALEIARELELRRVAAKLEKSIPWQTLDAFVRERLQEGEPIPLDVFGVFRQKFTTVKHKS